MHDLWMGRAEAELSLARIIDTEMGIHYAGYARGSSQRVKTARLCREKTWWGSFVSYKFYKV